MIFTQNAHPSILLPHPRTKLIHQTSLPVEGLPYLLPRHVNVGSDRQRNRQDVIASIGTVLSINPIRVSDAWRFTPV